jgi:pyridoxine kinase
VISISSHVARGSVVNRAMVFALERLGFEVWAVPTVLLPHHPGHGSAAKIVLDSKPFAELLEALNPVEVGRPVTGIVSGYLGTPEQAEAVAALVERVKAAAPEALYLCDPVIGDAGGLYVPRAVAERVRDRLLPLADIATPNAFECAWLAGAEGDAQPDLAALARALAPPVVLVTSAPAMMRGHIGNLLVAGRETILFEHPMVENAAKGTGDLLAALLLARLVDGDKPAKAAERALQSVFEITARTAKAGADELMLAALQDSIVMPGAGVVARRLGAGLAR